MTRFTSLAVLFVSVLAIFAQPAAANSNSNSACAAGTYSSNGKGDGTPCPAGSYQPKSGQTSCISASEGYYCSGKGSTTQTPAPSGHYCSGKGSTQPTPAPAGHYCGGSGSTTPTPAPAGHYCGGTGSSTPTPAPPGHYCSGSGSTGPTPAPPGHSCPGSGNSAPTPCQEGSFSGVSGAEQCCSCAAGWYSSSKASTSCDSCPATSNQRIGYCPSGSTGSGSCSNQPGAASHSNHGDDGSCPTSPAVPSSPAPVPSGHKRNTPLMKQCAAGAKSCPVFTGVGAAAKLATYECVDIQNDLESCGGCVVESVLGARSADGGRDCSAIPNVDGVSCVNASCVISQCAPGFDLSADGENCEPAAVANKHRRKHVRDSF